MHNLLCQPAGNIPGKADKAFDGKELLTFSVVLDVFRSFDFELFSIFSAVATSMGVVSKLFLATSMGVVSELFLATSMGVVSELFLATSMGVVSELFLATSMGVVSELFLATSNWDACAEVHFSYSIFD